MTDVTREDLTREQVAAADPGGMLGEVLAQPQQIGDALWRVESAAIPRADAPGGLIVCGMGGSAIGADLARAAIGRRARRPIEVVRGYELPAWAGPDTLVLCSSYSGQTEETLACFEAAGAAGAPRVALTTGGELAAQARPAGVPVIGIPSGMQPRAAVAYMTVTALECAAACGAAEPLRGEIEAAAGLLEQLVSEWGPDAGADSSAKSLAARLDGKLAVIYGAGLTAAPAVRWKTQINENAKWPAFAAELPEADHNEICAYDRAESIAPVAAVFLDDEGLHPRLRRRIELTAQAVEPGAAAVDRVTSRGDSPVERVMSLVLLGDLVSVYAAVLAGVDPTPVESLERFKATLAG